MTSNAARGSRPLNIAIAVLLAAVLALVAFAVLRDRTNPEAAAAPPIPTPTGLTREVYPTIAVIGDSYVGGSLMGGNKKDNFIDLMAASQKWNLGDKDGRGGSGYVASAEPFGSSTRLAALGTTSSAPPTAVFVVNGINDVNGMTGMDDPRAIQIPAAADALYGQIKTALPDAALVVVGYFSPLADRPIAAEINAELKKATVQHGGVFIDPIAEGWFTNPKDPLIGSDDFHPTNEGHAALAQWMVETMQDDGGMAAVEAGRRRVPCDVNCS